MQTFQGYTPLYYKVYEHNTLHSDYITFYHNN